MGYVGHRDLAGHKYGQLTVLSFHDKKGNNRRWLCRCDCGTECIKYGHQMRAGQTVSCGCEAKRRQSMAGRRNASQLTGQRFGRLVVVGRHGSNGYQKALWLCRCDCGEETLAATGSLKSGNTTSCGCFHKEMISEMFTNHNLTEQDRFESRNREVCVPGLHLWRKAVYARDNWTCRVCGRKKGIRIEAHHLDAWKSYPKRRLDEDNGATSCVDCHIEFHSLYGKGDNTEQQWREFVASKKEKEAAA